MPLRAGNKTTNPGFTNPHYYAKFVDFHLKMYLCCVVFMPYGLIVSERLKYKEWRDIKAGWDVFFD